jgi:hypothetical protein
MATLLKRITAVQSVAVTPNLKETIMNVVKAFLDGVFMLEMYSSKGEIGMISIIFFDIT